MPTCRFVPRQRLASLDVVVDDAFDVAAGTIYHSLTTLTGMSPDGRQLVADAAQQFDRVRSLADGEMEYLHGVIEFYKTVLSVKSTLLGQAQNEKVQQLTEASYAQNEEIKKSPPGRRSSSPRPSSAPSTA